MNLDDAVSFLRPALGADPGASWADLGAGRGTFTRALARLLGPGSRVVALDSDPAAVRALRRLERSAGGDRARVVAVEGDLRRLDRAAGLADAALDGALLANVLHFFPDPGKVLAEVAGRLRPGGRLVVIEYQGRRASPWIPHPLPPDRLRAAAAAAGLGAPAVVARRASAYRGKLYCAVARPDDVAGE